MGKKRNRDTGHAANPLTNAANSEGGQSDATVMAVQCLADKPREQSHRHTNAAPTGLGQQLSAKPGRLAREPLLNLSCTHPAAKWSPPAAAPSCCPSNAAAAVQLELARAAVLDQLRHQLASLSAKSGLRNVPLLAFERWRFAAKWAEDEPLAAAAAAAAPAAATSTRNLHKPNQLTSERSDISHAPSQQQQPPLQSDSTASKQHQKQKQPVSDPLIPFGTLPVAPEPGLVSDLTRAGLEPATAVAVAQKLAEASAAAAATVMKKRQQLASGRAASCGPVSVSFHKHSLDLTNGSAFVKISRPAYGKLARLYRQHWLSRTGGTAGTPAAAQPGETSCNVTVGLPVAEAMIQMKMLQLTLKARGVDDALQMRCKAAQTAEAANMQSQPAYGVDRSEALAAGSSSSSSSDDDCGDVDEHQGTVAGSSSKSTTANGSNGSSLNTSAAGGTQHTHKDLDVEAQLAELEARLLDHQAIAEAGSNGSSGGCGSNARNNFHARLFALLLRYKSIQGHGFQAAAGPDVFALLRQQLSVGFECFASPLNAHFSRFGSAFPDVDTPFGSCGSFFRMRLQHGNYEVNPPFVPCLLTAAAQHMLQSLQAAEAAGRALGFVVLMPGWEEVPGWQLLQSSSFLRESLLLAAADHGYCDGASHQRKDLYRQSPYDSSVMFLQTSAAAKKWAVTPAVVQQLQVAFAGCCPSAAATQRHKKQRGMRDLEGKGYGVPVAKAPAAAVTLTAAQPPGRQPSAREDAKLKARGHKRGPPSSDDPNAGRHKKKLKKKLKRN